MSAAICGDKPKSRMSLPPTLVELRRTSRSSGLRLLQLQSSAVTAISQFESGAPVIPQIPFDLN
jgi:hypothetical protein